MNDPQPEGPGRIYLQRSVGCLLADDTTWCADRVGDGDIEYVRAPAQPSQEPGDRERCAVCGAEHDDDAPPIAYCDECLAAARHPEPLQGTSPPEPYGEPVAQSPSEVVLRYPDLPWVVLDHDDPEKEYKVKRVAGGTDAVHVYVQPLYTTCSALRTEKERHLATEARHALWTVRARRWAKAWKEAAKVASDDWDGLADRFARDQHELSRLQARVEELEGAGTNLIESMGPHQDLPPALGAVDRLRATLESQ